MAVPDGLIESYSSVTTGNHLLRQKIFTICSTVSQTAVVSTREIFPVLQIAHLVAILFCHGVENYYVVLVEVTLYTSGDIKQRQGRTLLSVSNKNEHIVE